MSTTERDLEDCLTLLREGSHSFAAAARCLPNDMRQAATALYAFCRIADDIVDAPERPSDSIAGLTARLDAMFSGRPQNHPVDRALCAVIQRHHLARAPFDALVEGMAWDAAGKRYAELDDLLAYCARVAASVGAMMAQIMGVRDPLVMARACDLGLAMQLSNIARDVGEDARAGRIYLPTRWFTQYGVDVEQWLRAPGDTQLISSLVHRLLREAERLYRQGLSGVGALPATCQPGILAAGWIYRDIGRQIERQRLNPLQQRSITTRGRKLTLLAAASLRCALGVGSDIRIQQRTANPAVRFLVEACCPPQRKPRESAAAVPMGLAGQFIAVVELFQRLEQQDRRSRI